MYCSFYLSLKPLTFQSLLWIINLYTHILRFDILMNNKLQPYFNFKSITIFETFLDITWGTQEKHHQKQSNWWANYD